MAYFSFRTVEERSHHIRKEISGTRAKYRDGRWETAVKVYTVSQESNYLLILGVPAIGAANDLKCLCEQYGEVEVHHLDEYQCEDFTETYLVKYSWFPAARTAKKHLDDKPFFGGILHVCYAPEYETSQETSEKLQERRKYVSKQLRKGEFGHSSQSNLYSDAATTIQNAVAVPEKNPLLPSCRAPQNVKEDLFGESHQPVTYIWAGKEYTVYPQSMFSTKTASEENIQCEQRPEWTKESFIPRPLAQGLETAIKMDCRVKRSIPSASAKSFSKRLKF